jgi:hypothetical protein
MQIIIKKSDKTNKLIIMDRSEYNMKALNHLQSTHNYTITTLTKAQITQSTIEKYNSIITSITRSNLSTDNKKQLIKYTRPHAKQIRFPVIYFNPKTHKEGRPFRPIVSGIQWATENAAILIDEILKPIIITQPHLPKDSFAFIQTIETTQYNLLPIDHENIHLVTFDVTALYTSIPTYHAIQRITDTFTESPHAIPTHIITQLAAFVITNNYFTFMDIIYKQTHGVAMGNPAGASIANIYMIQWDKIIRKHKSYIQNVHLYTRYLDDGFIIWIGPIPELNAFIAFINTIDPNIQITANHGKSITYLDIDLLLTPNNIILTRTHRKPTAPTTYLSYTSSHPQHIKKNLPRSILFRSFIICNTQPSFTLEMQQIKQRFINSKYPTSIIDQAFAKTISQYGIPTFPNQYQYNIARKEALKNIGIKHDRATNQIYLPITYNPYINTKQFTNNTAIHTALPSCNQNFTAITSFKQPNNLLRHLTRSNI